MKLRHCTECDHYHSPIGPHVDDTDVPEPTLERATVRYRPGKGYEVTGSDGQWWGIFSTRRAAWDQALTLELA